MFKRDGLVPQLCSLFNWVITPVLLAWALPESRHYSITLGLTSLSLNKALAKLTQIPYKSNIHRMLIGVSTQFGSLNNSTIIRCQNWCSTSFFLKTQWFDFIK